MLNDVENQKIELEINRLQEETKLKEAETQLRRAEIELKQREIELSDKQSNEKKIWAQVFSPTGVAIIVGLFGLVGTAVSLWNTSGIEDKKRQSEFLIKWYEKNANVANEEERARNLLFFVELGFISMPNKEKELLQRIGKLDKNAAVPPPSFAQTFYDRYRSEFGQLTQEEMAGLQQFMSLIEQDTNVKDTRHIAYILATIKHETQNEFKPTVESGSDDDLENKYGPDSSLGKAFGNTEEGDGARYKGRGYIQILGKTNYQKINDALNLAGTENDLLKNPDKLLVPEISYRVALHVAQDGGLTGKKLSDYINEKETNYVEARRVVNGLDRANLIADYAKKFESILKASLSTDKRN